MRTAITKEEARTAILQHRSGTAFFDGSMSAAKIYNLLRFRMRFGEAETQTIIGALILAGAKFTEEQEG